MSWTPVVGQKVRAKITMINDRSHEGMGIQLCANLNDTLIVRKVSSGYLNCISVSHEYITDRAFCCAPDEIELIAN